MRHDANHDWRAPHGAGARELDALLEISRRLASELTIDDLVRTLVGVAGELFDTTGASVAAIDEDGWATHLGSNHPALVDSGIARGYRYPMLDMGVIWQELREGRGVIIDNVRGGSDFAAAYRRAMGPAIEGIYRSVRSWMAVPMLIHERLIGWLVISHTEPGRYTEADLGIAHAMASQAAVAMENARLFEETRRQAQEMEALFRADAELFSSLNLDVVLQALVDVMVDVLQVDKALVTMLESDGIRMRIRAHHGLAPESMERIARVYEQRRADGAPSLAQQLTTLEDIGRADPRVQPVLLDEGIRATLDAPIRTTSGVVGGFGIAYTTEHRFTDDERRLAQAIAERAAVAIQNAELYERAQRKTRESEALFRADAELFRTLDLDRVLQALVDVAVDVLGADKSLVMLHEGEIDVVRAARDYSPEMVRYFNETLATMPHEEPPPEGRKPRVYAELSQAPELIATALSREGVASHISLPVRDADRMLGVFGISFLEPHAFTEDEQRLYVALADRAAVAIKNAELYGRAQHAASLEERQRLARELHDSVSQALYGIALGAQTARLRVGDDSGAAEPIDYVLSLAQAGLAEMRALIFELRPESLEKEGLVAAIEKQVASTRARHSIAIEVSFPDEPECRLEVKEALYRIAQEALHNVIKHAQANSVRVDLQRRDGTLELSIADDGHGFDPGGSFPGHIGLQSMPERAARLGGTVVIESTPGTGTRVVARVPL